MRKHRYKKKRRAINRFIYSWIRVIVIAVLLAFGMVFFCLQISIVHGHDMVPTWRDGDLVLINKIQYRFYEPERQDIALIQIESSGNQRSIVRRIVGLPGETIQIQDGKLYVQDEEISLIVPGTIKTAGIAADAIKLGDDEYFVLCDNYNRGEDSRMETIGIIKKDQIVGKVMDTEAIINNLLNKYNLN